MSETTETIEQYRQRKGCTCPSFTGLNWIQLRDLGAGCASSGICPVLDRHRRTVKPTADERTAEDIRLARQLGIGRGVGL